VTIAKRIASRIVADLEAEQVEDMLKRIDAHVAAILKMRFGLGGEEPMTFKAIGERVGMSKKRISRIVADALRELRSEAIKFF